MNFYDKFLRHISTHILTVLIILAVVPAGVALLVRHYLPVEGVLLFVVAIGLVGALVAQRSIIERTTEPVKALWDVIQFVSPKSTQTAAPKLDILHSGREMIAVMANQVYQLAQSVDHAKDLRGAKDTSLHASFIANSLPLPLVVLDKDESIVFANKAALEYLARPADEVEGNNVYSIFDFSFSDDDTFDTWLKRSKHKSVSTSRTWERVRLGLVDQANNKQFDLAAHYNKSNPFGYETVLVLFDHTETYGQDDQSLGFIALTVHELRTPLTLLRGYIEVFKEEIGPKLAPDLQEFMQKMEVSGQQLSAFVDNILNVVKVQDNQLELHLKQENWNEVLDHVVSDLSLRTEVRGITIKTDIAIDLPPVAVDRYSIYEVLSNLVDNAVKYSGTAKQIFISASVNKEGMVETSVKDFGVGIDSSILPHIFDKFYRDHHNRAKVGGTGLGLYLCQAIVKAHHGSIFVRSKVGQGSTFFFTVVPYHKLSDELKANAKNGITREAHGWIKNHSYYKR